MIVPIATVSEPRAKYSGAGVDIPLGVSTGFGVGTTAEPADVETVGVGVEDKVEGDLLLVAGGAVQLTTLAPSRRSNITHYNNVFIMSPNR